LKLRIYNFFWIFGDRILKLSISLLIGIWIVRYFGPEYYGKFNFVTAWLTLMAAMVPFGTESILVAELVKDSDNKESLLASSFFLYLVTGIFFTISSIAFVLVSKIGDKEIFSLVLILSIPNFVRCFTVPRFYFESILLVKHVVIIENSFLVFFTLIKIFFLYASYPYIFFIWSFAMEGVLVSFSIYIYYLSKVSSISLKSFSWFRTKSIIRTSFPLFLSSMAIVLYMKVDQIMIGNMIGDRDLGIYSVAVRLSELWYFVPMAVSSSFYPHLIQLYQENRNKYWFELQRLHVFLFGISFAVAICVQIFSDIGIEYLYGEDFKESSNVLKIHVWSGVFVFLGVAGSNHFIISNIQKYSFYKSAIGLLTNIILNFLLIPRMGIYGAAIATLISQFVASSLFLIYNKETYILFQFQFKSLFFWNWFLYFLPSKKNFS
jgi:O-antigen/teichoic acid export membrane protein